jgi:hypothetical protein
MGKELSVQLRRFPVAPRHEGIDGPRQIRIPTHAVDNELRTAEGRSERTRGRPVEAHKS